MNAEKLAELFHETYERLAPAFGYNTRKTSRVEWERVPQKNRALMVAVSQTVLNMLQSEECAKETANSASTKCPMCGTNNIETRILSVCFNKSCSYIGASGNLADINNLKKIEENL